MESQTGHSLPKADTKAVVYQKKTRKSQVADDITKAEHITVHYIILHKHTQTRLTLRLNGNDLCPISEKNDTC